MQNYRKSALRFSADVSYEYRIATERDEKNFNTLQSFINSTEAPFSRETTEGHVTATAFIVDAEKQHALLLHHKKLDMWLPPGGHCDGHADVINTALRETQEETGLNTVEMVNGDIYDIDIHRIPANSKEAEHYHYDVRFIFEADKEIPLAANPEEANRLQWIRLQQLEEYNSLPSVLVLRDKMEVL